MRKYDVTVKEIDKAGTMIFSDVVAVSMIEAKAEVVEFYRNMFDVEESLIEATAIKTGEDK